MGALTATPAMQTRACNGHARIALIVPFLNEERHLSTLLASVAAQQRLPDRLLLIDDGSSDGGPEIAAGFSERFSYAQLLRRPRRPPERDRMVKAHEWRAFEWGLAQLGEGYDLVAKLDADLELSPDMLVEIDRCFQSDPQLGIAGPYLSTYTPGGRLVRQRCTPEHVEGEATFYRRECLRQISPVPAILGWDTIDEVRARMHGWRTASIAIPSGDPVHLRRMGSHDGVLRGYRRAGLAAYAYGAHPLYVALGAAKRMGETPRVMSGVHYMAGWALAAVQRAPRAERQLRAFVRRGHRQRMIALLLARGRT